MIKVVRSKSVLNNVVRISAAVGIVWGVTWFNLSLVTPNEATSAMLYLLLVLAISAVWGYGPSLAAAATAALGFSYILPPASSPSIEDPEDWLALVVFVATALTASRLSESARLREAEALGLRKIAERLLGSSEVSRQAVEQSIPRIVAEVFHLPGAAFYSRESNMLYRSGSAFDDATAAVIQPGSLPPSSPRLTVVQITSQRRAVGVLTLARAKISQAAHDALSTVVALAIERAQSTDMATEALAMRKRDELRATLLAAVAHDFRTPLTVIKGAATELLASTQVPEDAELLGIVDEEADRMNRLLGEALELGRLESGALHLQRTAIDIAEIVEGAAKEYHKSERIHVNSPLPAGMLDIEPERIRQVLRQLIDNALKYSASDVQVTLDAELRERDAVLSVRDNGPGIPHEEIDCVFDPFSRASTAGDRPGTGMGLAIARSLVEAHGGKIWVLSYQGRGSVFSFSVPLALHPSRART
jgi:two-component system sensor histidine kinase KdpD